MISTTLDRFFELVNGLVSLVVSDGMGRALLRYCLCCVLALNSHDCTWFRILCLTIADCVQSQNTYDLVGVALSPMTK